MKKIISITFCLFTCCLIFAQNKTVTQEKSNKGKFYFYWGWNRGTYSNSDIHFKGSNYDFTLNSVIAKDRQSPFDVKVYFNPTLITIPQYNARIGYFISNKYNISIGSDHMKYVVQQGQSVKINGNISNSGTIYDKNYTNDEVVIKPGFLEFEHTDGLNYANIELRRFDEIASLNKIKINLTEGIGTGLLYPKTNTTLLNKQRYDEFHVAGYGMGAMVGINLAYKRFFVQSELKSGFINMPDIRTTLSTTDRASQHFFFAQANIVFGVNFN